MLYKDSPAGRANSHGQDCSRWPPASAAYKYQALSHHGHITSFPRGPMQLSPQCVRAHDRSNPAEDEMACKRPYKLSLPMMQTQLATF